MHRPPFTGYGTRGEWREDVELDDLFPFWRRDLWSKESLRAALKTEIAPVDFLVIWRYSAVTRERRAIQIYEEF